jgi:hypothetical protein
MITIENVDKMVGTDLILTLDNIPKYYTEWICEKVISFPEDVTAYTMSPERQAYRFEYVSKTGYDVPLCIYLNRNSKNDLYQFENNLVSVNASVIKHSLFDMNLFKEILTKYAEDVVLNWLNDQNLI